MRAARAAIEYHSLCGRVRTVCPSGWVKRSASFVSCLSRPGGTRYLLRPRKRCDSGLVAEMGEFMYVGGEGRGKG